MNAKWNLGMALVFTVLTLVSLLQQNWSLAIAEAIIIALELEIAILKNK